MQPVKQDEKKTTEEKTKQKTQTKYIFFDFECTQDKRLDCEKGYLPGVNSTCVNCKKSWCGSMEHTPNLCVAHKVCSLCMCRDVTTSSVQIVVPMKRYSPVSMPRISFVSGYLQLKTRLSQFFVRISKGMIVTQS
jgi:hypothetical protein